MASTKYKTKIVDVSTKNREKFIPLISDDKRQYLDSPGCFCLGAVMDDGKLAHPVGVHIFSLKAARHEHDEYTCRIQLLWFYVSAAHRTRGVGSALFEAFTASVPGHSRVEVTLPTSESFDDLYNYLTGYGFEFCLKEYYELTLLIANITGNKKLMAIYEEPKGVTPLSKTAPSLWAGLSGYLDIRI